MSEVNFSIAPDQPEPRDRPGLLQFCKPRSVRHPTFKAWAVSMAESACTFLDSLVELLSFGTVTTNTRSALRWSKWADPD